MIDSILDKETLARLARIFEIQSGLKVGVYDRNGAPVAPSDYFSSGDAQNAAFSLSNKVLENVADIPYDGPRRSAVAMRNSRGELVGFFFVGDTAGSFVPFDVELSLIETVITSYLKERERALALSEDIRDIEKEGDDLTRELAENEVITEVLSKLENEDDFEEVSREILTLVGEFMSLSNAFLVQLDHSTKEASIISEWTAPSADSLLARIKGVDISDIPFTDGLSYTVSTDSRMPETFRTFLQSYDISAGVFLPIFLDEENVMYLCATMSRVPRHWTLPEAGFLNDVKRVINSILARRIAKNSLASSFAVVESVLENIGCGVLVTGIEDGSVLYSNDRFRTMFEDPTDRQRFERKIRQTPDKMSQIREYYVEGAGIYVSIALGTISWVDDSEVRLSTVFDISENKEVEKRVERQANIDELTGIYNRTFFIKELGSVLSKPHSPGAYICLNVDGFKEINLTSGSEAGDILLTSIAKFLLKLSEKGARVYRIGADEFAILITDNRIIHPREMAESIVKRFAAPWQLTYKDCYLTASLGISQFPEDADDVSGVLKCGDIALTEARRSGEGHVVFFENSMEKRLREEILLRNFLTDSVENSCNGMETKSTDVTYIIKGKSYDGRLYSLVWNAPELGEKRMVEFMPVARRLHMTHRIYEYLLSKSLQQLRECNDFGYPDRCFGVVIEASDFAEGSFPEMIEKQIQKASVNPARLVIIINGQVEDREVNSAMEDILSILKQKVHLAFTLPEYGEVFNSPEDTAMVPVAFGLDFGGKEQ